MITCLHILLSSKTSYVSTTVVSILIIFEKEFWDSLELQITAVVFSGLCNLLYWNLCKVMIITTLHVDTVHVAGICLLIRSTKMDYLLDRWTIKAHSKCQVLWQKLCAVGEHLKMIIWDFTSSYHNHPRTCSDLGFFQVYMLMQSATIVMLTEIIMVCSSNFCTSGRDWSELW